MHHGAARRDEAHALQGTARQQPRARRGAARGGVQPLQQKLQQHIDREDGRIKELTEAIMYGFLPKVLRAVSPKGSPADAVGNLSDEQVTTVACATLAVAILLNAPPGFLEFLLCVPWTKLPLSYREWIENGTFLEIFTQVKLGKNPEEHSHLINSPLPAYILDSVMDFLYLDEYRETLPPMMSLHEGVYVPGNGESAGPVQRAARAFLEGSTALHCAAVRGNPAQVDQLIACGANPLACNAVGETPAELVPRCGAALDPATGSNTPACLCMGHATPDQEGQECRSRIARIYILKRCIGMVHIGIIAWLKLMLRCLMCLLGMWGCHTSLLRPVLMERGDECWEESRQCAMARAKETVATLRSAVDQGRAYLDTSQEKRKGHLHQHRNGNAAAPEGPVLSEDVLLHQSTERESSTNTSTTSTLHHCVTTSATPDAAAHAYGLFSAAVGVLRSIATQYQSKCTPSACVLVPEYRHIPEQEWSAVEVGLEEQAQIYEGFAEASVAMYESCGCEGCASVASGAVGTSVKELVRLMDGADDVWRENSEQSRQLRYLAPSLAAAVHLRARLLLRTDVQRPATRNAIWRAQQCMEEWGRMRRLGVPSPLSGIEINDGNGDSNGDSNGGIEFKDPLEVECLESWAATAAADVQLIESLLGKPLTPLQPVTEATSEAIECDPSSGTLRLKRPISKTELTQLQAALEATPLASDHVRRIAKDISVRAAEEIGAGEKLREMLRLRGGGGGPTPEQLAEAVAAASRFPSLAEDVAQAASMQERWVQRTAAQEHLNSAIDAAAAAAPIDMVQLCSSTSTSTSTAVGAAIEAIRTEVQRRLDVLHVAVEEARQVSITVARVKKLQKELQAQGLAAELAAKLDDSLQQSKAGSGAIKAVLSRAEEAATAAAGGAGAFNLGSELLTPRIQAARAKIGVEKASEALARAVSTCRTVNDLPKLEAAILGARKVGALDIDPQAYQAATALRVRLDAACKARSALEASLRTLQRQSRPEDAADVERAIEATADYGDLLSADATRAREAVSQWHAAAAAEARLQKALREGAGSSALSRVIKEASSSGVKVNEARRVLKLTQALETAVAAARAEGGPALNSLQTKIQAAAAGGVPRATVAEARRTLHHLLLAGVRSELDAALRMTRSAEQRPVGQRLSTLKSVLDKVDAVLIMSEEQDDTSASNAAAAGSTIHEENDGARPTADSPEGGGGTATPPLLRDFGGKLGSQGSFASQHASSSSASTPTWQNAAAAAVVGLADCDAITLRLRVVGDSAVAAWFEPAGEGTEVEGGFSSDDDFEATLGADADADDASAVRHMAHVARKRLAREEREHARLERQKSEEARMRRELQAKEKAAREAADRERADRARAEKAERKAALEAQKAERREKERAQRAEREHARQEREAQAREHFVLLQRRRKALAEQARAVQIAQLLADQRLQHEHGAGFFSNSGGLSSEGALEWSPEAIAGLDGIDDLSAIGVLSDILDDEFILGEHHHVTSPSGRGRSSSSAHEGGTAEGVVLSGALAGTTSDAASVATSALWGSQEDQETDTNADYLLDTSGQNSRLFSDLGGATWLLASGPAGGASGTGLGLDVPPPPSAPTTSTDVLSSAGLLWGGSSTVSAESAAAERAGFGLAGLGSPSRLWGSQGADLLDNGAVSRTGASAASAAAAAAALAAADRDAKLIAALDAAKAQLHVKPRVVLCKYFAQGFCREGDRCSYSHAAANAHQTAAQLQRSMSLAAARSLLLGSGSSPASQPSAPPSFAFGAPGSNAFSHVNGTTSAGSSPAGALRPVPTSQMASSLEIAASRGGVYSHIPQFGALGNSGGSLPEHSSSLATAAGLGTPPPLGARSASATPRSLSELADEAYRVSGGAAKLSLFAESLGGGGGGGAESSGISLDGQTEGGQGRL